MPRGQLLPSDACEQRFRLTKMCTFYAAGKCKRGSECTFAHDPKDLLPQLDLSKTSRCKFFFQLGSCQEGSACRFAHSYRELRGSPSKRDPAASGQDVASSHQRAVHAMSELDNVEKKHESVMMQRPLETAAQSRGGQEQAFTSRVKMEHVERKCKLSTTFLSSCDSWQGRSCKKGEFTRDDASSFEVKKGHMRSNKSHSGGGGCTYGFERELLCTYESIKAVNLHLNFNGLDRTVHLPASDSSPKRDIISCMDADAEQSEQVEVSVKRTFIDVEVKKPKVIRSQSVPSVVMM